MRGIKMTIMMILGIAVLVIILAIWVRSIERDSIFYPVRGISTTPLEAGLEYEDVYFNAQDNVLLNGWYIPPEEEGYTVLLCHGNGGNIGDRVEKAIILNDLGLGVFLFDYRGYGRSRGVPSEEGLYADAEAAYEYLTAKKKIVPEKIVVYGESLGAPVAVRLAARSKAAGLVTEGGFTSVKDMAAIMYPLMPGPLLSSKFDTKAMIKDVRIPKLIMHSRYDDIVPFSMAEEIFREAGAPKTFIELKGRHNMAFQDSGKAYSEGIKDFIQSLN